LDTAVTSAKLFAPSIREHKTWISRRTPKDAASLQQPPDEVLLKCVQEGDREALGCLFRRYARALHGIRRRILRDVAEAEDLVQEVFVYVHRERSLYDSSKGTARSWIFQIAYTQAFLRRRQLKSLGFYASGIADMVRESDSSEFGDGIRPVGRRAFRQEWLERDRRGPNRGSTGDAAVTFF
jgi:DNA-directed RNA polymerase specialized sigma24 family protein